MTNESNSTAWGASTEPNVGMAVAFGLLTAVALLGNVATIGNFVHNDWLKTHRCHVYILGLAVADLGTALVPLSVSTLVAAKGLWPLSRQACMAYDYFRLLIENNGVLITLLISVDRFRMLRITFTKYVQQMTPARMSLEIGLTWLVPATGHGIFAIVWIIGVPLEVRESETTPDCQDVPSEADIPFSIIYAALLIFIPGFLLGVLNTFTFFGVVQKLKGRRKIANGMAFRGPPSTGFGVFNKVAPRPPAAQTPKIDVAADPGLSKSRGPITLSPSLLSTSMNNGNGSLGDARSGEASPDISGKTLQPPSNPNAALKSQSNDPGPSTSSGTKCSQELQEVTGSRAPPPQNAAAMSQLRPSKPTVHRSRHADRQTARYIRPAVMLAGIVTVFTLCWFPFAVYFVHVHVVCPACFSREVQLWLRLLMYANSAINPFIYALTDRKVRQGYGKIWRGLKRRMANF